MAYNKANPDAPFGYEDDGITPKAPYGYKTNGKPRLSNRGARPGGGFGQGKGPAAPQKASKSDAKRRDALVMMAEIFIATPLAGLSTNRLVKGWIGERQADALAGDSVLISHISPHIAEGLIEAAQDKPSLLAWLDKVDEKAPWMKLTFAIGQLTKMVTANHLSPNTELNAAGRKLAQIRMAKLAAEIEAEAAQYGVSDDEQPAEHPYDQHHQYAEPVAV